MSTLATKAIVKNPDGSLFYREEHEWPNLDANMLAWFRSKMQHMTDFATKNHGKKEDGANLSAELTATVDGVAVPGLSLSGVSYKGLMKFEREFHKVGAELLDLGDGKAKSKK